MTAPLAEATAGAIGAVFSNTLVFPLDVIKTRLQVQSKALDTIQTQYKSIDDAFYTILSEEGVLGLFNGWGVSSLGTVASSFSYFYIYSTIRKAVVERSTGPLGTGSELLVGAAAGALSQFFVLPIAVVTTRKQTVDKDKSLLHIVHSIKRQEGYSGFWKGLRASLILCSNPAITYGVFERLKGLYVVRNKGAPLTSLQVFFIGALSKALATVVTCKLMIDACYLSILIETIDPYIMAKVKLQWKIPLERADKLSDKERASVQFKSTLDVLQKVYKADGFTGLYAGLLAQILKAVLSQAILFVSKEKLTDYTLGFFAYLGWVAMTKKQQQGQVAKE